jgi:hypothetical protein
MNYLSALESLTKILNSEATRSNKKKALIKMFLLECRSNQKLLAIASWKNVSDGIRNEALKNLSSDSAKSFYALSDSTILGSLLDTISFNNSKESKSERASDTSLIISMITRIDALHFLGNIPSHLQNESKARLSVRISNLNKVVLKVIGVLESQVLAEE